MITFSVRRNPSLCNPLVLPYCLVLILLLLLSVDGVHGIVGTACDYMLSDSPKEGKVVHTFKTSCHGGEILWRYPFGGLELTFRKPKTSSFISALRPPTHDDIDDIQFCYVVINSSVNVTMFREMPGPRFASSAMESCLNSNTITYDPIKFYIESSPSLHSSLVGKFQLLYMWSKPTPFEQCKRCSHTELSYAACSAGSIFTGHALRSRRGIITVSISKILLFNRDNVPKRFCLQRRNITIPLHLPSGGQFYSSFFPNHKCDKIIVPNKGQCSVDNYDELIFIADTSLQRFRPRCVLPERTFWKTWKLMESRKETHCHL